MQRKERQELIRLIMTGLLLVLLTACQSTGVPLAGALNDYIEYLSTNGHHKAFATTRARRGGQTRGWATGQPTLQAAIDAALNNCDRRRSSETTTGGCMLHSIGNRDASGLTGAKLEESIRQYKADPNGTR